MRRMCNNLTPVFGLEETVAGYVEALTKVFEEVFRVLSPTGTVFLNLGDTYYSGKGKSHGIDQKSKKRRFGLRAVDKSGGLDLGLQRKSIIGIPWRVAASLTKHQWVLRSPIIWHRDKCLPEAVHDRPRRSYEFVFMFAKSRHYYFNRKPLIDQNIDEDVWTIRQGRRSQMANLKLHHSQRNWSSAVSVLGARPVASSLIHLLVQARLFQ